jgi:hypothetical protein
MYLYCFITISNKHKLKNTIAVTATNILTNIKLLTLFTIYHIIKIKIK